MELLAVIGFVIVVLAIFTGGGILGWILRGLGKIFGILIEGWSSTFRFLFWILFVIVLLLAMLS